MRGPAGFGLAYTAAFQVQDACPGFAIARQLACVNGFHAPLSVATIESGEFREVPGHVKRAGFEDGPLASPGARGVFVRTGECMKGAVLRNDFIRALCCDLFQPVFVVQATENRSPTNNMTCL